jgi:hypothetical protein
MPRPQPHSSEIVQQSHMRIHFQSDGGLAYIPGLSRPRTVDTALLPAGEAAALEDLVQRAEFFAKPVEIGTPAPGSADQRAFTITVEDAHRSHTVKVTEPVSDPALATLLGRLASSPPAK